MGSWRVRVKPAIYHSRALDSESPVDVIGGKDPHGTGSGEPATGRCTSRARPAPMPYGSDAIAAVVDIILEKGADGGELEGAWGILVGGARRLPVAYNRDDSAIRHAAATLP